MKTKRMQILLESHQYKALKREARRLNKSLSALVREITNQYLAQHTQEQGDEVLQALESLRRLRERQPVYRGQPVVEARAQRERQMNEEIDGWILS